MGIGRRRGPSRITFIARHVGWVIAEEHIYIDDGVSGAEWLDRDLNRLIAAAQSTPRGFDVLVTLDLDRVGRDAVRTVPKLHEIYEAGVRIFFYQDGQEVHLRNAFEVFMLQAKAFAAADYRDKVRLKTRDALRDKAARGYVVGGIVYGYENRRTAAAMSSASSSVRKPTSCGISSR